MEPHIRYVRTADEVNIAYFAMGDGPPMVVLPYLPMSHLQNEWRVRPLREWVGWFAGHRTLIRYDARMTGLSSPAGDLSLDAHLLDLAAVLDALALESVDLLAGSFAGPIAIAFAARYPGRVRRLALWTTHAFHQEVATALGPQAAAQADAIQQLASLNLDLFLRAWLHRAVGWIEGATADAAFNLVRSSMGPEEFPRALRAYREFDARPDLGRVQAPTLVMHRRDFPGSTVAVAQGLARRIPGATLVLFEGESVIPFVGESTRVLTTIDQFFGQEGVVRPRAPLPGSAGADVRTLLFTDVVDHTGMTQRIGDRRAREVMRAHDAAIREALAAYDGEEVKSMGDGFMASFRSAQRAIECAVSLQRTFERMYREGTMPARVRMGLNAGEPIEEDGDLFGSAVIAASRIAECAQGGEILVANVVRELVTGQDGGFGFEDRGLVTLKGFEGPFHLFAVRY